MYAYGNQQTVETTKTNLENWLSLHANKNNDDEMVRYNKERIRKHKIRMIEGWRGKC